MLESSHIFVDIFLEKHPNASIAADFYVLILGQVLAPGGTSWTEMFWEETFMEVHAVGFIYLFFLPPVHRVCESDTNPLHLPVAENTFQYSVVVPIEESLY